MVDAGQVVVRYDAIVSRIHEAELEMQVGGDEQTIGYDELFIQIGFESPTVFLKQMGITVVAGKPKYDAVSFETNVSGLYIAGTLTGADSVVEASTQAQQIVHQLASTLKG